jgi:hypothetical protein
MRAMLLGACASGLLLTGCAGWFRANSGYAYSTAGQVNHSGPMVGVDTILTAKPHSFLNHSSKNLPLMLHTGLEGVLAADLKTFSWTTGAAYYSKPRPVGGYVIAGANGHFDLVNGKPSVGNFHPYAELGLATPLGERDEEEDGLLFTFGAEFMFLVHYLAPPSERTDGLIILKFGIAWERN